MNRIMEHLKELSVVIGSRAAGSQNEKKAGEYIEQTMRSLGMQVEVEEFRSNTSLFLVWAIAIVIFIIAGFVFPINAPIAFLLGLAMVAILAAEMNMKQVLSRIMPKRPSRNIIGKITPNTKTEKHVVLMGHYDSAKPLPFFHPAVMKYLDFLWLAVLVSLVLSTVFYGLGSLIQWLAPQSVYSIYFWIASWPLLVYSGVIAGSIILGELFMKHNDGANDNASGISVILSVGETFSKTSLTSTEVWFVATGCEEVGTVGMKKFLDAHARELKDSFLLSVDVVGNGNLRYVIEEGPMKAIKVPDELVNLVRDVATKYPELQAKPLVFKHKASDAYSALARGLKAICIVTVDEHNLPANLHWKTDVFENIEEHTVEKAEKFVIEILRTIDAK